MLTTGRIADMMTTDFAVETAGDTAPVETTILVPTGDGLIAAVHIQADPAGDDTATRMAS